MPSAISLRGLTKEFAGGDEPQAASLAVDRVELEVGEGELLALAGPRGCGKSTLVRLIAGLEHPTAGEVYLAGQLVAGVPARSRNVGFMPQGHALFERMTVADNIGFGVRLQRVSENECQERVQELVLLMGLEGFDKLRPHELSPSQRQRVTLARAMAPRPALLLLDEPFAEAGAKTGRRLGVAVKEWQRGLGTPVILVTRDRRDTMELGDRVAVMCAGRIEQVDTPENLHKSPATEFVARFVGRTGEFHAAPHAGSGGVGHGFPGDAGLPVAVSAPLRNGNGHATGRPIPRGGLSYTFLGRKVNMEVEVALASRVAERAQPSSATSTTDPTPEGPVPLSVGPYRVAPLRLPARNGATNGSAEHATESPG